MRNETSTLNRCGRSAQQFVLCVIILLVVAPLHAQDSRDDDDAWSSRSEAEAGLSVESTDSYAPYPAPDSGYVTDLAGLLTLQQEERIEQWLWQVEEKSGVEIAVVTIRSIKDYPNAPNGRIESFAAGLFNAWGIGNMPQNDGVLLLVAVSDRKARIELGAGYGRSRDNDAKHVMDDVIIPEFRKGDYAAGITDGVEALVEEFSPMRIGTNWALIILLIAIPVVGLITFDLFRRGKRGWGWVCAGLLIVLVITVFRIIFAALGAANRASSSGGWSSGGFGGGFGGGFSGGGGATGGW